MSSVTILQIKHTKYRYINVAQSNNCIVVRVLQPFIDSSKAIDYNSLTNTDKILGRIVRAKYARNDVEAFIVVAEGIFDVNSNIGSKWWKMGEIVDFFIDTVSVNKGVVQCAPISSLTNTTSESRRQYSKRNGVDILLSVKCDYDNQSLIDAAKVLCIDCNGVLITNLDTDSITYSKASEIEHILQNSFDIEVVNGCTAQRPVEIMIKTNSNANGHLYIDNLSGYVPYKKVLIKNGVGKFILLPLLLEETDPIIFRYHTKFNTVSNMVKFNFG